MARRGRPARVRVRFPGRAVDVPGGGRLSVLVTYAALSVLLYGAVTLRLAHGLPRPHLAVILFLGFATMSLLWSSNPIESTVKLAGLVTALLLGAVFAASGTHVVQAVVIKAGAVGLTLSVLLVFALPHIGLSQDNRGDFWQGAFATKNVFGRISALCLVTAVVVALSRRASRPHRRMAGAVALLGAVCLYFSGSVGAHISAAACAVVALALLPLRGRRGLAPRLAGVICVTTVVGLVYYAVLNPQVRPPARAGRHADRPSHHLANRAAVRRCRAVDRLWVWLVLRAGQRDENERLSRTGCRRPPRSQLFPGHAPRPGLARCWPVAPPDGRHTRRCLGSPRGDGSVWPLAFCSFVFVSDVVESTSLNGLFPALLFAMVITWRPADQRPDG